MTPEQAILARALDDEGVKPSEICKRTGVGTKAMYNFLNGYRNTMRSRRARHLLAQKAKDDINAREEEAVAKMRRDARHHSVWGNSSLAGFESW